MEPADLTLEQQFQLKVLANHIHGLNQQQLQNLLLKSVQLGMMKDNQIRCYKLYPYNTLNVDISRSEKIVS